MPDLSEFSLLPGCFHFFNEQYITMRGLIVSAVSSGYFTRVADTRQLPHARMFYSSCHCAAWGPISQYKMVFQVSVFWVM